MTKRIVIVGAGGLGTPAALELVSEWPAGEPLRLHIIDPDTIERSNLNRQILFHEEDLGAEKAATLAARIQQSVSRPEIEVHSLKERLNAENAGSLLSGAAAVLDCTDHIPSKFLLNDCCAAAGIPFCYAGAVELEGLCLAVPAVNGVRGCLRCLFGDSAEAELSEVTRSCQTAGILGPVVGLLGIAQARLTLGLLQNNNPMGAVSRLHRFTAESLSWQSFDVTAAKGCPLGCGISIASSIDLRERNCPYTFLYTKLALEKIEPARVLEIFFGTRESVENVGRSVTEEGHRVVGRPGTESSKGFRLLVERGP